MTLEQFIGTCRDAISSNYATRNLIVFTDPVRQRRIQKQRRDKIRDWVACLRLALNPATAGEVAEAVAWKIH
jgi:hypothetical protein